MIDKKTCVFCEYFDGGGRAKVEQAIKTGEPLYGDCLNHRSPRFQTWSNDTCSEWTPDSTESRTFRIDHM